jgi:hypothetical protein
MKVLQAQQNKNNQKGFYRAYVVPIVSLLLVILLVVVAMDNRIGQKAGAAANAESIQADDDGRNVFDPDLGAAYNVSATSLNTLLDPVIAKGEYERYIAEQTANGFTVDTMNFVYISYSALDAYYLSNQDESLLGIDVEEFYEMERMVGPNQYYWVDENGNLSVLDFQAEEEEKATWLDRLAGAALAVGTICVGVIIVAAVSVVSCGAATAAAPYIMGAFIGAGMEIFMQTVVQGKKIKDINWVRVSIAAVSGALAAIPGIGWLGAGLLQGGTEAAMTWAEGGSIEDILKAFTVGFITGVVIHGVGKALSKIKFCFVAGTAVVMASGATKAIEDIRVGDIVQSYNERINAFENKRVTQTFVNEADELIRVTLNNGEVISATPNHPFFANNTWIEAQSLKAGDRLLTVNGKHVVVEFIQHEILEAPIKVYNFTVDGNSTYVVGDSGVVVHNVCKAVGKSHGNPTHKAKIDNMVSKFEKVPNVTEVYVNKSLKTAGLNGTQRPDIIVKLANNKSVIVEVASPSQLSGIGKKALAGKIDIMKIANGGIKAVLK